MSQKPNYKGNFRRTLVKVPRRKSGAECGKAEGELEVAVYQRVRKEPRPPGSRKKK